MLLVTNKQVIHDYSIIKKIIVGVVLKGYEVKSLRLKAASLKGSYVKIINLEAFLINAQINPYKFASVDNYEPKRTRKLLLKKKELIELKTETDQKNMTIVPLAFLLLGNMIKLEIALAKGKKEYEKRELLKKRDLKRRLAAQIKEARIKI